MSIDRLITLLLLFCSTLLFSQQRIKHKVVQGESIYSIAKKYNVTEEEIFALNPKAKGILALNTELLIPKSSKKKVETKKVLPKGNSYTVQNGESFYTISRKFNVGYETLTELNPEIKPENLQIGEVIRLPKGVKVAKEEKIKEVAKKSKSKTKDQKHVVGSGESFYTISKKYNVSIDELRKANPQIHNDKLDVKDIVFIPGEENNLVEAKKSKETNKNKENIEKAGIELTQDEKLEVKNEIDSLTENHRVEPRETKFGIAKKYGLTVAELNALNPNVKELKTGQILVLRKNLVTKEDKPKTTQEYEEENVPTYVPPMDADAITKAEFLISKASECLGVRYRSGGSDRRGFDCSGFVSYTFKYLEMDLPRSSWEMANVGIKIDRSQAQKGDLIFFKTVRSGISHVGMITEVTENDIKFIHSSTNNGVIVSSVNEAYYSRRFVQINRILN